MWQWRNSKAKEILKEKWRANEESWKLEEDLKLIKFGKLSIFKVYR